MNRQQQIDVFLLEAHRLAVQRLRQHPGRAGQALALLARWRERNGSTRSDLYRDEWARLLDAGPDAVEQVACAADDHGAALRSVSPLSVLITQRERLDLLRRARTE
jgi:hypothetical protein